MSLQSHVAELQRRHQALEKEIQSARIHPATSDRELAELKRKKLQLKDEIEKLRTCSHKS
jgi:hypothetical protein